VSKFKTILLALVCFGLAGFLKAQSENDSALSALVQVLSQTEDPQFQLDVLKGVTEAMNGRRAVKMPEGWEAIAEKLGKSPNADVRELAQSLSVTFGSASAFASLREQLMNRGATLATRTNALNSLTAAKDRALPPLLQELLTDKNLRGPALRALAGYDDSKSAAAILLVYPSLESSERRDALNTLVSRAAFAKPLLAAIADKTIASRELSADLIRQLRNLKNPEIDQLVAKFWGVARESAEDKLKEIAKYKAMLQSPGIRPAEAFRGRSVFARTCQQCHTLFDVGGKVGPDLTGSNRNDLDYILQNMLDPNAVIPNDYRSSTLETKDDRVITGIVTKQDNTSVTIITANETLTIPRNEIQSLRQSEISMMPEGLLAPLSDDEVRDLIAYLRSSAQVPLP
jgi:putative heme-binding domain-containing protein